MSNLLPLQDLRCLSAEGLGAKIAAASPELSVHCAAFLRARFGGAALFSYAPLSNTDFEQLLMHVGVADAGHHQRLISELRLLRSRYAALEVPPLPMLPKLPPALHNPNVPKTRPPFSSPLYSIFFGDFPFYYNPNTKMECLDIRLPCLYSGSSRFVVAAWVHMRAIDSGHLASMADLAWLLLHGREGLPQNKDAAFHMAQEGSRRGCPHSQGVLALCVFRSEESYAANKRTVRQLANASAEAGSKYGQFALGRILENETPDSERSVAAPHNAQYALAAAQGLDEAQVEWGRTLLLEAAESEEEAGEGRRLFKLAAAQGSCNACVRLWELALDDEEKNYWCERQHSVKNPCLYSAGLPHSSAALAALFNAKARLNADAAANQPMAGTQQLHSN
jgi:hypothetical protein